MEIKAESAASKINAIFEPLFSGMEDENCPVTNFLYQRFREFVEQVAIFLDVAIVANLVLEQAFDGKTGKGGKQEKENMQVKKF